MKKFKKISASDFGLYSRNESISPDKMLKKYSCLQQSAFSLLLLFSFAACGVTRPASSPYPATKVIINPKAKDEEHHPKDTVKFDIAKKRFEDSLNAIYPITIKSTYTIGVYLPLYLNDSNREQTQKTAVTVSQDFYKGLLIAADTLKHCGRNMTIHVYDSENPFLTPSALDDTITKNLPDLLIGPLLEKTQLTYLDTLAKRSRINLVSPIQTSDKCPGGMYYIESIPSNQIMGQRIADKIIKEYPDYRVLIINEHNLKDNPIAQSFYTEFSNKDSLKVVNYNGQPPYSYNPVFPLSDKNIVFITSKRESFVTTVLSKLRVDSTQIVVFGTTPWLYFNSQEGDLWNKFNIHIATPFFIDFTDPRLSGFIKTYRSRYQEEPSVWAYIGFDEITYYGTMLNHYGRYFQRYLLNTASTPMLHNSYDLRPDPKCHAWKNNFVNMVEFEDYRMVRDTSGK